LLDTKVKFFFRKLGKYIFLGKNKIEGTPILKLAMVKKIMGKKYSQFPLKNSPKKFTQKTHRKSSHEEFTQKIHPKSSPKKFTKKVHQKSSPKKFTKKVHQKSSPKKFTKKFTKRYTKSMLHPLSIHPLGIHPLGIHSLGIHTYQPWVYQKYVYQNSIQTNKCLLQIPTIFVFMLSSTTSLSIRISAILRKF
jgi:hypothetical protein